jgi:hypothetical protein
LGGEFVTARRVDDQPVRVSAVPVKPSPEWRVAHGHGGRCPFDWCPDDDPSWNCPMLRECTNDRCTCHYGAFL